ncbi:hypothetical protein HDU67_007076 [Dinochytrium kinnereticum]|nr:hypothetical protein HDU67_007076 [Dinochytrium kinnereticum]
MGAQKPPHSGISPQLPVAVNSQLTIIIDAQILNMAFLKAKGTPCREPQKTDLFPMKEEGKTLPIPESYWVDPRLALPPARTAFPIISYQTIDTTFNIPQSLPFDRLHMDQANWGDLLNRKHGTCWASALQAEEASISM